MMNKNIQKQNPENSIKQEANSESQKTTLNFKTISDLLFPILLLSSMALIVALSLIVILTDFQTPLPPEYFIIILGAANTILVFTIIDMFKAGPSIIKGGSQEVISKHPSELIPRVEDLPENWKISEEDELPPEIVAWNRAVKERPKEWGFEEAFARIFAKGEAKVVFSILKFSTIGKAKEAFTGIYHDWKNRNTYPVSAGKEAVGVFSESDNFDGTLVRKANILGFILLYDETGTTRRASAQHAEFLKGI